MTAWRRAVLLVLVSSGSALAQADRPAMPRHQDPVVQGVQDHLDRLCEGHDARLAAIDGPEALERELGQARRRFLDLLGLDLDTPRSAPKVVPAGTLELADYRIEKLVIESSPGVPVPCNVYVPRSGPSRKPALLCPHGHSGRDRPVYQNAYQRFAKAGFVVLAKDGWGKQERRGTGHGEAGGQLALTGTEVLALELFDNVRCLDYLAARPDVDAGRLGMVGLSGGGSQTLYAAAVEPRLRAASPTCAVTTFRADLADTTMCVCEMAHDILTVGDHGLFLAMASPRPLLVVNGTRDPIFPVAGARAAVAQASRLDAAAGRPGRVEFAEFDAAHDWSDAMIDRQVAWFRRRLDLPEQASVPPGDGPHAEEPLGCFADGDLPAGSATLSEVNRSRMRGASAGSDTRARGRSLAEDRDRLAEMVRRRWSGAPALPARVERRPLGPDPRRAGRRERLSWPSGLGGTVTAVVSRPADDAGGRLVVHLEDRDRPEPQLERLYWDDRIRGRSTVVTLAYTGAGLDPVREGQVGSALVASGRSLLAERVRDLLVALIVLREETLLADPNRLALVGHGFDGVLLLAAAPLLPPEARLVLDRSPISYLAGAEVDFATPRLLAPPYHWTILPGLARQHDLAELLELAHPRPVLLAHPLDAAQQALGRDELAVLLGRLSRTDRGHLQALTREQTRADAYRRLARLITDDPDPAPTDAAEVRRLAGQLLDDALAQREREAIVRDHPGVSAELIAAMADGLPAGVKEEYRRIPWIWRVAIAAGRRNDADELRRVLDVALPAPDAPLDDWRAVVLGGGLINGISLSGDWPDERIARVVRDLPDLDARWKRSLILAAAMADDERVKPGTRYDALRMLGMEPWDRRGAQLFRYLLKGVNPELQQGAIGGLSDMRSPCVGPALLSGMGSYTPRNRELALDALLRDDGRVAALLDAVAEGRLDRGKLGAERVARLVQHPRDDLRRRAAEVFGR